MHQTTLATLLIGTLLTPYKHFGFEIQWFIKESPTDVHKWTLYLFFSFLGSIIIISCTELLDICIHLAEHGSTMWPNMSSFWCLWFLYFQFYFEVVPLWSRVPFKFLPLWDFLYFLCFSVPFPTPLHLYLIPWLVCVYKVSPPRQFVPCSPVVPSYVAHLCYFLSLFPSLPVSSCGVFLVLFLVFSLNLLLLCHFVLGTCFSFFWISFCLIKLALKSWILCTSWVFLHLGPPLPS